MTMRRFDGDVDIHTRIEGGRGRIVYMPTTGSENEVTRSGSCVPHVPISREGRLLPEVIDVLDLVAQHDLVLSTGHSSPQEILLPVAAARMRGVDTKPNILIDLSATCAAAWVAGPWNQARR